MGDLNALQEAAGRWHRARFPDAEIVNVALKLCEEAGEVGRAVNGLIGVNSATGGGDLLEEQADVLIALFAMVDRWPVGDVEDAAWAKLARLNDPNGGHRASLPTVVHASPPPWRPERLPCCGGTVRDLGPDAAVSLHAVDVTCEGGA